MPLAFTQWGRSYSISCRCLLSPIPSAKVTPIMDFGGTHIQVGRASRRQFVLSPGNHGGWLQEHSCGGGVVCIAGATMRHASSPSTHPHSHWGSSGNAQVLAFTSPMASTDGHLHGALWHLQYIPCRPPSVGATDRPSLQALRNT